MNTIYSLRKQGWKIRVYHTRNKTVSFNISPRGGFTRIEATTPDGKTAVGTAICSDKDNFDRKVGNSIALGRALKALTEKE
jgi:hypothetical protein